ncbi:SDR family NAD(P)-dependent oxidoreductase [Dyella sp. KULCS107]|uniref:SDR family NAD(P)-dependent oxidoreductase n=1 Tax=Dyella sp. KULCS107 TaxID=3422216 RepID=UPI003D6F796F
MKIALITGASRGIGHAAALACARHGFGVVATYRSHRAGADALVEQIRGEGGKAVALSLDVGDVASFERFTRELSTTLEREWGRASFDGLVNNAGHGGFHPFGTITEAVFDGLMNVHLKGPLFLTQALLPLLADGGSIVNVSSATTRVATVGVAPYAAMKGGLDVLTRYIAKEFGPRRIRANSVSPGAIRTELGDSALDKHPEFAQMLADQTALGRVGEATDVAGVIASLLLPDSGWVNAQRIEVGGGYCI